MAGEYRYGIGAPYGFGWAVKGFASDPNQAAAMPAFLHVDPWKREPDTRSGYKPTELQGTLTATGLSAGANYDVYRWDSVKEALTYSEEHKKASFTATSDTYLYTDDAPFMSDGTTYYRVIKAAA